MKNALILLAGGTGTRANSNTPKQFVEANNTAIFIYSILPFLSFVKYIVIVVHDDYVDFAKKAIEKLIFRKKYSLLEEETQASILQKMVLMN